MVTLDIPRQAQYPAVSIELGWGEAIVRTRKRSYLVAFAIVLTRKAAFIQFGDWHTFWLKHAYGRWFRL